MYYRWFKLGEEGRRLVWRLYGWFSGLMMCGSCVGTLTWAAYMQVVVNDYIGVKDTTLQLSQRFFFWSISDRWKSIFYVTYSIEFLCLSVAKLLVLDRMSEFVVNHSARKLWVAGRRIVLAAVVAGNAVALAANIAASIHRYRRADLLMSVSSELTANVIVTESKYAQVADELQLALFISSVQEFSEAVVLLLIVLSFAVVGIACARRITSAFSGVDAADPIMSAGRELRRQILYTTAVTFVTFVIRSVYSIMFAVASNFQDFSNMGSKCLDRSVCDSCFNVFNHMYWWMFRTPEFLLVIVILSKPLPLLIALWGMTTGRMRRVFVVNERKLADVRGGLVKKMMFWRRDID
jgi:hypothetical protein